MKKLLICLALASMTITGCAESLNRTQKGSVFGSGVGALVGAGMGQAIGRDTGSTLIGAAVGAAFGGVAGGLVGNYMDKQEAAMRENLANVEGASIQRNMDTLAVTFKSDILFKVNSYDLQAGSYDEISRVANVLNQYPQSTILIAGHTDSTGADSTNQTLSERRAASVKNALIGQGVVSERMTTIGYGEKKPIADNATEAGRQINRRVVIIITPQQ